MALSEQEQRLLEELERNLYSSGRDRVVRVDPRSFVIDYRALVIGAIVVIAGIIGLVVGAGIQQPLIGLGGFAVMFIGAMVALNAIRSRGGRSAADED